VAIDTRPNERALPLAACRLQGIDPYTFLINVQRRVSRHPDAHVDELKRRRCVDSASQAPKRCVAAALN